MLRITLSAEDAKALGSPEVINYDPEKLRIKQVLALNEQVGMTRQELAQGLTTGEDKAKAALVWLALLNNGVKVAWEDFDYDIFGTSIDAVDADPKEETK